MITLSENICASELTWWDCRENHEVPVFMMTFKPDSLSNLKLLFWKVVIDLLSYLPCDCGNHWSLRTWKSWPCLHVQEPLIIVNQYTMCFLKILWILNSTLAFLLLATTEKSKIIYIMTKITTYSFKIHSTNNEVIS